MNNNIQRKGLPRPSERLLQLLFMWTLLGLLYPMIALLAPEHAVNRMQTLSLMVWGLFGGVLIVLALWDLVWIRFWAPQFDVDRHCPSRFAVGEWNCVTLHVAHNRHKAIEILITDHLPSTADYRSLPASLSLLPGQSTSFKYQVKPTKRGELVFGALQLLYHSRLMFWLDTLWVHKRDRIKVYPNFIALHHYELALALKRASQSSVSTPRPREQGALFHQLRHYLPGDERRHIDWKASSRHHTLISKTYQIEKDQTLLFLLDCGRRMRARDGELSHFDYAMKSVLLLSYAALRQGDSVGLLTFGGKERWLPPGKSAHHINRILNTLYDLDAEPVASDYLMAAKSALTKLNRRASVVLVSNVRDEHLGELIPALKHLQQRHSVLMANLREQALEARLKQPVSTFEQALSYAGTAHYLAQRCTVHERFMRENIPALEAAPADLPSALVEHYRSIVRR